MKSKLALASVITWVLCILVFILSIYVLDANKVLNSQSWVARCGTIIIIIAALSEWRMLKRVERFRNWTMKCSIIPKNSSAWSDAEAEIDEYYIAPVRTIVEWSNIFLMVAGTILTGFGDLLYQTAFSPLG